MATFTRVQHNFMATTGTSATNFNTTLGSGVVAGNLLVATIVLGTDGLTLTPPAGWVQAGPTEVVSGSLDTRIYYLVVSSGGGTSWNWSFGATAHSFGWTIEEWNSSTGWLASPVDSSAGNAHTSASTAVDCGSPSATTQASELWIGVLAWGNSGQTLSGITAGWTTGDSAVFTGNNTQTAFSEQASSTGTPSLAATISASNVNTGVVATFKPATAAAATPALPQRGGPRWRRRYRRRQALIPPVPPVFVNLTESGTGTDSLSVTPVTPALVVTPQTVDEVTTSSGTATSTHAFTPTDGSLVFISAAWLDNVDQLGKTFTCADNHGNSYSFAAGGQGGDADGGCYLLPFEFQYTTSPGSTTVTITASGTGATAAADCLIQPYIITGQASDQSTAANNKFSEVGTPTSTYLIAVTPTVLGSAMMVLAAPNHNGGATGPVTPNANTVTDVDWDDGVAGSRGTVGRSIVLTAALTSTTYGWTSANPSPFGYGVMAVEVLPAGATAVGLTDSGAGSDAVAITQPTGLTDTGSGADALSLTQPTPLTVTGTGSESLALAQPTALATSGTGTDALALTQPTLLTDAGTGTDALALGQPTAFTDTGAGSDGLGIVPGFTDAGTGSDVLGISTVTVVALTDAGTGADTLGVMPGLTESGSGADTLALTQPTGFTDSGTGSVTLGVMPGLTDTGSGADVLSLVQPTPLTDTGSGSDNLGVMPGLTDTGTAAEVLGISQAVTISLTDTGTGADTLATLSVTPVAFTDAGTGAETLATVQVLGLAEAGAGLDALGITAVIGLTDTGTGTEVFSNGGATAAGFTETGHGTDTFSLVFPIPLADAGAGSDTLTITLPSLQPLKGIGSGVPHGSWAAGAPHGDGYGTGTPHGGWAAGAPRDNGYRRGDPHRDWNTGEPHD